MLLASTTTNGYITKITIFCPILHVSVLLNKYCGCETDEFLKSVKKSRHRLKDPSSDEFKYFEYEAYQHSLEYDDAFCVTTIEG